MRSSIAVRLAGLVLLCVSAAAAEAATKPESLLPRGVKLPAGVALPNDTTLATYLPADELDSRFYLAMLGGWIEPGKSLNDARTEVVTKYFPSTVAVAPGVQSGYGLLLVLHPEWKAEGGQLKLSMKYRVYDPAGALLREGVQAQNASLAGNVGAFQTVIYKSMQMVMVDILRELTPSAAKYPPNGSVAAIPVAQLVSKAKAVRTGTAFYVNPAGQLMTAAHVIDDCTLVEAKKDGLTFEVQPRAQSALLDLAVLDSGRETTAALPLRKDETLVLGESVTLVGFPLSGLLSSTPNVTRGNVSARAGIKGSVGQFQFSAPTQPGSSGGPVVSDGGELLGIAVGTLNVTSLAEQGLLPQNVNFALDAKYVSEFLNREKIAYQEVPARTDGNMQRANEAAIASVVQLSCYQ